MNNGIDMSEEDALLEQSQSDSDAELTYRDPLLSQLTESELSATESCACTRCPLAMWFFRNLDKGSPKLTAYCSMMHRNTFGGDSRDEMGVVSKCGKQIQVLEAWKAAKEKALAA